MNHNLRKVDGIEINKVPDGSVVYCPVHDKIHYLNLTAAMLLELSDGETSVSEMKQLIKDAFDMDDLPGKEIDETLQEMIDSSLII